MAEQTMLLAVCLLASCLAAPLSSGSAAFERDYDDQRPLLPGTSDSPAFESELSASEVTQLPASFPRALARAASHMNRHEIALLSHTLPVAGAPERRYDNIESNLFDGREEMQPGADDPLDDDCDSPQLGDIEPHPQSATTVEMNDKAQTMASVPEQNDENREVLMDSDQFVPVQADAPSALGTPEDFELKAEPVETKVERALLPVAIPTEKKCSRSTNGNDVPDPLAELGEDCGMPEPVIPCETRGNSTKCAPSLMLVAPPIPMAERMPPILPSPQPVESMISDISIELPDFGISRIAQVHKFDEVETVIIRALREFQVLPWHIQMVRNFAADIPPTRKIFQLEDSKQLVVYLKCVRKAFLDQLIVRLPACEDLEVKNMQVRVEVPETDDVFITEALSIDSVATVISRTPIPSTTISKITYNGMRIRMNQTLEYIHFANKSALVIYLVAVPVSQPIPQSASPSTQAADCADQTIQNVDGQTSMSPSLPSSGSAHDFPQIPIPSTENDEIFRSPMKDNAVVKLRIADSIFPDYPVLVKPTDQGIVLFDALRERTGKSFKLFTLKFHRSAIQQGTELGPIGLLTDDVIPVQMLPPQ